MQTEYVILSIVRLGLVTFSFLALPPSILMVKSAWQTNDKQKMRKAISLFWGALLAGALFIKMFKGAV